MIVAGVALALSACRADGSTACTAAAPCSAEAAQGLVSKPQADRRGGHAADQRHNGSSDKTR